MRAEREPTLLAFAERARAFLGRDPVGNTVVCGVVEVAGRQPERFEDASWFTVTGPDGEVAGAAIQTPPYPLGIVPMSDPALAALADVVAVELPDVGGLTGPLPYAGRFAELWATRTGTVPQVRREMRLFRLDAVTPPAPDGGRLVPAGELAGYRGLFADWVRAFVLAIEGESADEPEQLVERLIDRDGLWVWCDDGVPVSFASATMPAYATTRIGLVYTPEELRGRGYASRCVAALSQRALDAGVTPVLFTDLANPTSNRIYRQIGYRPVLDAREYAFTPPTAP